MATLTQVAIGMLLVGGVALGTSFFYTSLYSNYGLPVTNNCNSPNGATCNISSSGLDQRISLAGNASIIQNGIQQTQTVGVIGFLGTFLFGPIKTFFTTIATFTTMTQQVGNLLSIPSWFTDLIIIAFGMFVTGEVISTMLFRRA